MKVVNIDDIIDFCEAQIPHLYARHETIALAQLRGVKEFCKDSAVDVQSIKHGWWIEEEPRVLKCSVCGEYAPMNYLGQNCIDSRYCPWCGTKMDSNADEPWQSE